MSVIEKVSQYCKTLMNRLNQPSIQCPTLPGTHTRNIVSVNGQIIYNTSRNGFYGFRDDENNLYYITNIKYLLPNLKDRQRIHVVMEILNGIDNVERWGKTAQLYTIKPLL